MNGQFKRHQLRGYAPTAVLKGGIQGWPHPNIYEISDVFRKEEASTKMKMLMLEAGAQQAPRRWRVR